ncbi:MAG: methyl-accepting chemotaxis protein, partial [Heliobacteriaceae bacterium]|nr:methyl-accepting chemotaxis protein [Heliobacteriaceae bacterium]
MKWFYNQKIGTKLLAGFIIVALIAGVVGYVGIININEITARDTELYEYNTLPLADIGEASAGFQRVRIYLRDICMEKDMAAKSKYVRELEELAKEVMEHLNKFEAKLQTQEGRNEFAKVKAATTKFVDLQEQIIQLATSGQAEAAMALLFSDAANKAAQEVNDGIVKLYQMKLDAANKLEVENDATSAAAVNTMLVFAGIAVALAIGLGIFITRIITRPVQHLQAVMGKVEQGDLTVRGEANTKDELGQLTASFNQMLDYLREFVQKVQDGSRAVAAASEQISASTQQVA